MNQRASIPSSQFDVRPCDCGGAQVVYENTVLHFDKANFLKFARTVHLAAGKLAAAQISERPWQTLRGNHVH
jgi:hypothetical protein